MNVRGLCVRVAGIVCATMVPAAHASLISRDLVTSGDQLLTYDDQTHLEWLDLTATAGQSYRSVADGYGGYTTTQDFRFATVSELQTLFGDAGIPTLGFSWNHPENYAPTMALLDKIGILYQYDQQGLVWTVQLGWTADAAPDGSHTEAIIRTCSIGDALVAPSYGTNPVDWSNGTLGSFLVRTASIPEPSFFLIAAAALPAGLLRVRSRKR